MVTKYLAILLLNHKTYNYIRTREGALVIRLGRLYVRLGVV